MKIQEFCKYCNTTKKTIHFYIKEGIIAPSQNEENGYYEFNQGDLDRMKLIQLFRSFDFSIQEIKECFTYPTLTNFFLHRHARSLKSEIQDKLDMLSMIYQYIEQIPPNAIPQHLTECLSPKIDKKNTDAFIQSLFPEIDARMIAIILLAPFLQGEVNDYQHFLWDKISNELHSQLGESLPLYQRLIYHLSAKQIIESTSFSYYKYFQILNSENLETEVDHLLHQCNLLLSDERLIRIWKQLYIPLMKPTLKLFKSSWMRLIKEYNPNFTICMEKLSWLLKITANRLIDSPCHKQLNKVLGNTFKLTAHDYDDLFLVFYFENSIFTQLSPSILEKEVLIQDDL